MMVLTDLLIAVLLVIGGAFALIGSWGLVRLPDTMTRLHAPTKATTVGVGAVLIASMIHFGRADQAWGHEFLITLLLLLTAPISALFMAKTVIHRSLDARDLPPAGEGTGWATLTRGSDTGAAQLAEVTHAAEASEAPRLPED